MRAILYPSEISGRVDAPPSKRMAHRALICAALAKGESRVLNLSASQDITATLAAMRLLGASAADMDAPDCRRGAAAAYAHWSGERTVSGPGSLLQILEMAKLLAQIGKRGSALCFIGKRRLQQFPQVREKNSPGFLTARISRQKNAVGPSQR